MVNFFPLTDSEIESLKTGKVVSKNYYPELEPYKMLHVVAWNKSKLRKLDKRRFHAMRAVGVDVANIPLQDEDIEKIENGDGFSFHYSTFEILVLTEETLKKVGVGGRES